MPKGIYPRTKPPVRRRRPVSDRFWEKVDLDGPIPPRAPHLGPCWLWTACGDPDDYGMFTIERGKVRRAHIVSYELEIGPAPAGLHLDHLCSVRRCVRPSHLEPVTPAENVRRSQNAQLAKTHCPQGHPYDETNTFRTRIGHRRCRTCKRAVDARRRADRAHLTENATSPRSNSKPGTTSPLTDTAG